MPGAMIPTDHLDGWSAAGLSARLGRPDLLRREAAAQVWQYRGATCLLDVFLYPDARGAVQVVHASLRPIGTGPTSPPTSPPACLDALGARAGL